MIKFAFILERLCGESGQLKKWNFHNYLKVDTKILESGKNITIGEWYQWHIEIADTPFNIAPALSSICSPHSLSLIYLSLYRILGFPGSTSGKESACQCRKCNRLGSFSRSGRPPGGGHGNPLKYSCLENPMDKGAWWAAIYGVTQNRTRLKWLSSSSRATELNW